MYNPLHSISSRWLSPYLKLQKITFYGSDGKNYLENMFQHKI